MPKKKIDYDKAAKMLFSRTEHYADNVRRLYATATDELLKLSAMKASNGVSAAFSFSDSKRLSEQANTILRALYSGVYNEIKGGVIAEWENANKSCDALITSIFGKKVKEDNHYARYFARNKESVDVFFKRKSEYGGLNLSQRVWKYVGDFKTEMEMALSVAMGEGKSAATISREVRKYLQRPDMMFRRFRVKTGEQDIFDADGNVIGKEPVYGRVWKRKVVDAVTGNVSWQTVNLKDYSFGRGVYRSSYKNAMRLARTETNMAYRTADQERWRQLDFVIGYRVVLSDNHPEPDICDDLSARRGEKGSRGVYPKDFVFKGWHPQCRCYVVPILADEKEFDKIQEAILNDEPIPESKSVIREPNKYFQDWWKSNKKRVSEAQSLPYWVKDNSRMLGIETSDNYSGLVSNLISRRADKQASKLFSNLETHKAVADKLKEILAKQLGNDVEVSIISDGVDLQLVKSYAAEITKLTKQYKLQQGKLSKIVLGYKPDSLMEYGSTNYNLMTNTKQMYIRGLYPARRNKEAIENSRCDKRKESVSVVTHEFGHLLCQFRGDSTKDMLLFKSSVESLYQEYLQDVRRLITADDMKQLSNILLGNIVTNGDVGEFLAEAFQEYKNCSRPSKYAKSIGRLIDDSFGRQKSKS